MALDDDDDEEEEEDGGTLRTPIAAIDAMAFGALYCVVSVLSLNSQFTHTDRQVL